MSEDKDIDKLFQQGAEQYGFDYNPDAWGQMEVLLDKEKRKRRFWWWLSGLFVAGLFVIGFLNYSKKTTVADSTQDQITNTKAFEINDSKSSSTTHQVDIVENSSGDKETLALDGIKNSQAEKSENLDVPTKAESHSLAQKKITPRSDFELLGKKIEAEHEARQNTNGFEAESGTTLSGKKIPSRINAVEQKELNANMAVLHLLPSLLPKPLVGDAPSVEVTLLSQNVNVNVDKSNNQWLIGIFLASELSSVELENISKNNFRFGAQTAYHFKRKFGANMGVSYTRKKYKVNEGDYTPPKGFWTRKIAPQSTEATTDILEVPVSVAFFPKGYQNNGLYSNLGLTSYFMLKEQYRYSYDLSDPDLIRQWQTEKENNHWFGVGQFSIGYQRVMSPKTFAQFGTYVQAPLTGIGHGNVKLWSFGLDWKINFLVK